MIVEEQHTGDGLDRIEHHYYLGHSLIETRDNAPAPGGAPEPADAGRVLSQSIWDSLVPGQYVDALAQVAHNLDPGVDHDPATPEVDDLVDTRLYALQDVSGGYNILGLVNQRGDLVERREYDLYGRMTVYHPAGQDFGEFAAADISGDGVIDLGDLVILSNNFGNASSSHADGDMNGDGVVDLGDLVILSNKFGDVFRSENDPLVTAPSGGASGRLGFGLAQAGQSLCDFGFQGLRHLRGTSFADNRARVYDRYTERFVQRDPWMQDEESGIPQAGDGYPDGMNGYAAYHVMQGGMDPTGNYTLPQAESSLNQRGVQPGNGSVVFTTNFGRTHVIKTFSKRQIFNEWLRLERARALTAWWKVLPKCPCTICTHPEHDGNPDPTKWNNRARPGWAEASLHPGAYYSMRSKTINGHSNQCIYDKNGDLMTTLPSAGSVDYRAPGAFSGHRPHDVTPVQLANELDGGVRPATLIGLIRGVTQMKQPAGPFVQAYYTVRPSWHQDCPKNP